MESRIKNILILSAGLLAGGLIGAFITKQKYEELIDEEIESVKEVYERKIKTAINDLYDKNSGEIVPNIDTDDIEEITKEETSASINDEPRQKINYNDIISKTNYAPSINDEPRQKINYNDIISKTNYAPSITREEAKLEPYIISLDEFNEDCTHYDKITLNFYEDDGVLTEDDSSEPIDIDIIGVDATRSFGEMSEDPEVVYIRNNKLQIDYEVIRLSKSYAETMEM